MYLRMGRRIKQVLIITKDFKGDFVTFKVGDRFPVEELTVFKDKNGKTRKIRGYGYCELMDYENNGAQIQTTQGDWEGIPKDCFRVEFVHKQGVEPND